MTYLWSPPCYGTPPVRVRRNAGAWAVEPGNVEIPAAGQVMIMPDGMVLGGPAEDALTQLQSAGPRGAAALGAAAGLLFSGWKAAIAGGVLGYFGGKYIVNIIDKALMISSIVKPVETPSEKATS
jgi:hypothetical protein